MFITVTQFWNIYIFCCYQESDMQFSYLFFIRHVTYIRNALCELINYQIYLPPNVMVLLQLIHAHHKPQYLVFLDTAA